MRTSSRSVAEGGDDVGEGLALERGSPGLGEVVSLEFGSAATGLGERTSGMGTKNNAIAAKAKLAIPSVAGAARFAIGWSALR